MGSTKINLTEEQFTEVTLSALKEHPEGITEYPILDFDDRALGLLSAGVAETLRYSEIKPRGGLAYRFLKRLFDIVGSALSLILLAIPMGIVALVIYLDDKGSPIFSQARLTKDGKVFYMHKFRSIVSMRNRSSQRCRKKTKPTVWRSRARTTRESHGSGILSGERPLTNCPSCGTFSAGTCPLSGRVRRFRGKWCCIRPTRCSGYR